MLGGSPDPSSEIGKRLSSLNLEHVSPASLIAQEISRRSSIGQQADRALRAGKPVGGDTVVAVMRRWFWARKPDAGFVLYEFPATLLQAKIFDEWLDARGEALDGVITDASEENPLVEHYRTLGLVTSARAHAA